MLLMFYAGGNFQKEAGVLRRGLKEAADINGTTQKQSTQGGNPGPECEGEFGLVVPCCSGNLDFRFRIIGSFGAL